MAEQAPIKTYVGPKPKKTKKEMSLGSVLITGGSGFYGKALVRHLLHKQLADKIIVFSRGEHLQEQMARDFAPFDPDGRLRFRLGDVRDEPRLELAMRDADIVVHAAAMKVVPACEANPNETIKTNVLGTENVIQAALRTGIVKVMFISSDKASANSTLYGATKFVAERSIVAANALSGKDGCRFSAGRWGNVKNSSGSVIPLFKRLIADGARVLPITDVRMTRFFWEVEDAVAFTLSSLEMMRGGEVFIPKIQARRIVDVAREIAPTLPQSIIGIRPGEKLHELLISEDESINAVELDDRYVLCPFDKDWDRSHLIGANPVPDGFRYCSEIAILEASKHLQAAE